MFVQSIIAPSPALAFGSGDSFRVRVAVNKQPLISYTLSFEIDKDGIDLVELYCKAEVVKFVEELGFRDPSWEDEPVAVVLYEKKLD